MDEKTLLERIDKTQKRGYDQKNDRTPICAFSDEYSVHFFGPCAAKFKSVIGDDRFLRDEEKVGTLEHVSYDLRNWNPAVTKLELAGILCQIQGL